VVTPVSFWAGLPLALGIAASLLGGGARAARGSKVASWALGTGLAAIILSVVLLVLGNTVLSR
jgi:hypothetical protein